MRIYFLVFCFLAFLLSGNYSDMSKGDEHHSSLNSVISLCTGCLPLCGINHHLMVLALISNPAKIHHHSITFFIALTLQLSVIQTCFHRCDFQLCSFMLSLKSFVLHHLPKVLYRELCCFQLHCQSSEIPTSYHLHFLQQI